MYAENNFFIPFFSAKKIFLFVWSSSKSISDDLALHPRWQPWVLIGWKIGNLWKSSSSKQLDGMKPKLTQIIHWWSPLKLCSWTLSIIKDGRYGWLCKFGFQVLPHFYDLLTHTVWRAQARDRSVSTLVGSFMLS